MLAIDLKGRRAFVAGVADDTGFGFAIVARTVAAGPRPAEFSAATVIRYDAPALRPLSVVDRLPPERVCDFVPPESAAQVIRYPLTAAPFAAAAPQLTTMEVPRTAARAPGGRPGGLAGTTLCGAGGLTGGVVLGDVPPVGDSASGGAGRYGWVGGLVAGTLGVPGRRGARLLGSGRAPGAGTAPARPWSSTTSTCPPSPPST